MADVIHMKKVFLIIMIVSLILAALIGVIIFLIGDFTEVEKKLLGTTASITGFSLIGLFFSWMAEKLNSKYFSWGGLILVVFGFISSILLIWEAN